MGEVITMFKRIELVSEDVCQQADGGVHFQFSIFNFQL